MKMSLNYGPLYRPSGGKGFTLSFTQGERLAAGINAAFQEIKEPEVLQIIEVVRAYPRTGYEDCDEGSSDITIEVVITDSLVGSNINGRFTSSHLPPDARADMVKVQVLDSVKLLLKVKAKRIAEEQGKIQQQLHLLSIPQAVS